MFLMTVQKINVAIIGAGLGGLAAGIAIARAGHNVTIIERASALAEVKKSSFSAQSNSSG